MKQILIILSFVFIFFSCNTSDKKENELLKKENELLIRELEIEKKENQTKETPVQKEIVTSTKTLSKKDILNSDIKKVFSLLDTKIGSNGDFSFDMGSASSGRVSGNLKEVDIVIEYLPERPGCADICPEMAVIYFKCKYNKKCVSDPGFISGGSYSSGSISFQNLKLGSEIFDLLNKIQTNL